MSSIRFSPLFPDWALQVKHFRTPLIVTGVVFLLVLLIGIGGIIVIVNSNATDQAKAARSAMLGSGVATTACLIVAPFWIFAAAKLGKERRAALAESKKAAMPKKRKKVQE